MSYPYVFRHRLLKRGIHFEYVRLRCGAEAQFTKGVKNLQIRNGLSPRIFAAFSEWDALIVLPCDSLYPEILTELYTTPEIAYSVSGSFGYFGYLWNHPINRGIRLDEKVARFERRGLAIQISLRFDDWFRRQLGLGAELLFCDFLEQELHRPENSGISATVAHTLGWNDVALIIHANSGEERLTRLLSDIRLLTLQQCLGRRSQLLRRFEPQSPDTPLFVASYSHLISGHERFSQGNMVLGNLTDEIATATLLVRAVPGMELNVRTKIATEMTKLGFPTEPSKMPSEMGHYSLSVDVTELAKQKRGRNIAPFILQTRELIGRMAAEVNSSYAETSLRLRFREPAKGRSVQVAKATPDLERDILKVGRLLEDLRRQLEYRGASPMTVHRFSNVVSTLVDNLSDPVRSSVVRHLTRFMLSTPKRVSELDREGIDDLCHVCEYAMTQALDGVAQFQHDAPSLGLSGRGGYSRLIVATETYMKDMFITLGVKEVVPLITFGLRTGEKGSIGRFQVDVTFNVLFVASSWYVLMHEAAHSYWISHFGWMIESLAAYEALEHAIRVPKQPQESSKKAAVEFIRTREIVREFFPNYLVYKLACGSNLAEFDRLSLRHIVSSRLGGGTRELLIAVVLHALLELIERPVPKTRSRGIAWWKGWATLRKRTLGDDIQNAIDGIDAAIEKHLEELQRLPATNPRANDLSQNLLTAKMRLLKSRMFHQQSEHALRAVIEVLALSSEHFGSEADFATRQFSDMQQRIDQAVQYQDRHFKRWTNARDGFAEWLAAGYVLSLAPFAHVWSRLLLESRDKLRKLDGTDFMVSQLSTILSIWHRAVTSPPPGGSPTALQKVLKPLNLVEPREFDR